MRIISSLILAGALGACGGTPPASSTTPLSGDTTPEVKSPVVSWDILAREPVANEAQVKHILIGWKELADKFRGGQDPRAAARSQVDADDTVKELLGKLAAGGDFDALMREFSEDTGSASSSKPMKVSPDAGLVIEFRQLSLRLNVAEVGVCQSEYGYHIIKRYL